MPLAYYPQRLPRLAIFFALSFLVFFAAFGAFSPLPHIAAYSFVVSLALLPLLDDYAHSRRVADLEQNLPAALFRMSSLSGAPFEDLLESAASAGLGEASRAFGRVRSLANAGFPARQALLDIAGEYDSEAFRRTASLLASLHDSGEEISKAVHQIAEDSFDFQQLSRESAAVLSVQKYTLLVGAALLVPFIFAALLQASKSLADASPNAASTAILPSFAFAAQLYLVVFACLSSCFVALQEGNLKKAVAYSSLVAPLSLLVFNAVGGASWVSA